jgi:hypothetical protein
MAILLHCVYTKKQAQKGFRPLSAMSGIGYFQNLRIVFEKLFGIFLDILENFFGNFLGGFLVGFLGKTFWEGHFW